MVPGVTSRRSAVLRSVLSQSSKRSVWIRWIYTISSPSYTRQGIRSGFAEVILERDKERGGMRTLGGTRPIERRRRSLRHQVASGSANALWRTKSPSPSWKPIRGPFLRCSSSTYSREYACVVPPRTGLAPGLPNPLGIPCRVYLVTHGFLLLNKMHYICLLVNNNFLSYCKLST